MRMGGWDTGNAFGITLHSRTCTCQIAQIRAEHSPSVHCAHLQERVCKRLLTRTMDICPLPRISLRLNLSDMQSHLALHMKPPKETNMNTDQVKGAAKEVMGKVQQKTGEILNSPEQQVKGVAKQVEGSVQKNYGDAKEDIKDATK